MYGIVGVTKEAKAKELMTLVLRLANPFGDKARRVHFLLFIAAMETNMGNFPDNFHEQGKGLFQVDSPYFKNVCHRFLTESNKVKALEKYREEFGLKLKEVNFEELDFSTIVCGIITTLGLLLIPKRLPAASDLEGVIAYYKKYYNSSKGKASTDLTKAKAKEDMVKEVYEICLGRKLNDMFFEIDSLESITTELYIKLIGI